MTKGANAHLPDSDEDQDEISNCYYNNFDGEWQAGERLVSGDRRAISLFEIQINGTAGFFNRESLLAYDDCLSKSVIGPETF